MPDGKMPVQAIARLLGTIAAPKQGERMLFLTDYSEGKPSAQGAGRQELVSRWYKAASLLSQQKGFNLLPLALYRQTGKNNADLPKSAATQGGGHIDDLPSLVKSSNIAIAMSEYSASAPLKNLAASAPSLRVVSMPGVNAEMEGAMSADYARIDERARRLLPILQSASGFEAIFDGAGVPRGTSLHIDTRASNWIIDSGSCHNKWDFINFPS